MASQINTVEDAFTLDNYKESLKYPSSELYILVAAPSISAFGTRNYPILLKIDCTWSAKSMIPGLLA